METLPEALIRTAAGVAALGGISVDIAPLTDTELRAASELVGSLLGFGNRYAAMIAGETAHRSRPELGHSGMAATAGFLSAAQMVQATQGVSHRDAMKLIEVGTLIARAEAVTPDSPSPDEPSTTEPSAAQRSDPDSEAPLWQRPLVAALNSGALSIDGADSIRRALGEVDAAVTAAQLSAAADELIAGAAGVTPEALSRRARQLRDRLDEEGIARREKQRDDLRSVRMWTDAAGMHCGFWRLAPEDGLIIATAFDALLSPRRGGPRFVHPDAVQAAEDLLADARTREQIAADGLVGMIRLAVDADPTVMHGARRPAVRVLVTGAHLSARAGHGRLEGQADLVPMSTVYRHICDTGTIALGFDDDGQCVNVGRNQRLFTERQRIGMAARDGGCMASGCDRPPSWCEAHHINHWHRDHGDTNIADGLLLCRRHHLDFHNNGWEIHRNGATYYLTPPPCVDPEQKPIRLISQSAAIDASSR
ncbi:HNH endonuclease signature motif containing protein [Lacisediminihabitans sp.]|jgi:hypothetical protein|uniref:HNH endonuclease signature motif containing protein n=1 Tax=Lacisediminihabitans sp. TaxID=2787631 RepID=UPI002F93BB4C